MIDDPMAAAIYRLRQAASGVPFKLIYPIPELSDARLAMSKDLNLVLDKLEGPFFEKRNAG